MIRVLIVGSNPSQKSGSVEAFWHDTKSRKTIQKWQVALGDVMLEQIDYMNVSNKVTPNNRPLKTSEIKAALPTFEHHIQPYVALNFHIVSVGKTADKALTLLGITHYAMPHPSGLNRQLNDSKFVEEKIKGLQNYLSPFKIES